MLAQAPDVNTSLGDIDHVGCWFGKTTLVFRSQPVQPSPALDSGEECANEFLPRKPRSPLRLSITYHFYNPEAHRSDIPSPETLSIKICSILPFNAR